MSSKQDGRVCRSVRSAVEVESATSPLSRRTFLAGAGLGAATVAIGGVPIPASAQDGSTLEEWLDDAPNYEGVVDYTGEDDVRVSVGAADGYTFEPAAIRVDPGTTVVWEWTGESGGHDVTTEDESFGSEFVDEKGYEFEHTFDEEGVARYMCTPHVTMGMKGAVVVGDAATDVEAPAPSAPAGAEAAGLQSIPMVPGVAASLGLIAAVTVAISRWTSAGRDDTRVHRD